MADDASTDGSVAEVAVRFPEVQVVRHKERLGATPADPMYVFLTTTVTFKVVAADSNSPCADASISWGGTSGASGTGASITVTFGNASSPPTDYKTVTATCGNTVTVNVVVYDLRGILTPADNFPGRSQSTYGLNEDVALSFETIPAGLTDKIGRLEWSVAEGGVGGITGATESGTGTYNAGANPGDSKLDLTVLDCPSDGLYARYLRTVIAPNGGTCVRVPGSGH